MHSSIQGHSVNYHRARQSLRFSRFDLKAEFHPKESNAQETRARPSFAFQQHSQITCGIHPSIIIHPKSTRLYSTAASRIDHKITRGAAAHEDAFASGTLEMLQMLHSNVPKNYAIEHRICVTSTNTWRGTGTRVNTHLKCVSGQTSVCGSTPPERDEEKPATPSHGHRPLAFTRRTPLNVEYFPGFCSVSVHEM